MSASTSNLWVTMCSIFTVTFLADFSKLENDWGGEIEGPCPDTVARALSVGFGRTRIRLITATKVDVTMLVES